MSLTNHLPQASSSISKDILNPQYHLKTKQRLSIVPAAVCSSGEASSTHSWAPHREHLYSCTICWQLERWHSALSAPAPTLQGVGQRSRFYKTFKNVNMATKNSHKHRQYVDSWTYMSERGTWDGIFIQVRTHDRCPPSASLNNQCREQTPWTGWRVWLERQNNVEKFRLRKHPRFVKSFAS